MALIGHIDVLSRERIEGWAWDDDRPNTSVGLVIAADGRVIARCLANRFRPDLIEAGIGDGYGGFKLVLPRPLSSLRAHEISLRREGDGAHLHGSPLTLAAPTSLDAATKSGIEDLVAAIAIPDMAEAIAFFASQTERLRDTLAGHRCGASERQRRRGLGWQEPGPIAADAVGPVQAAPRALVIDDRMPRGDRDAGSVAILSHMRSLRRLGYDVTFVPADLGGDAAPLDAEGIATCLSPWYVSVEDVLRRQPDVFRLVYLHRMTNAARYLGLARQHQPRAGVIYGVADLHFLRAARQAKVQDRPELLVLSERQRLAEFAAAALSDAVITHSTHEAGLLRAHLPQAKVHVVPWDVTPRPTTTPFAERRGVAFIASYDHAPNVDAALFLLEHVMPDVWMRDAFCPCLFAGSGFPPWLRDLVKPPAEAVGMVPDLATLFERVRLTVAPLSFGAGIKGKVLESLAAGIPCVCTSIAAEGLDLPAPLSDLVADDPASLASLIVRLEQDEAYNAACARAGLEYVAVRLSEAALDRTFRGILG